MQTKTALVTGGSSGIGLATAKKLKELSYEVTIICRDKDKGQSVASNLGLNLVHADLKDMQELNNIEDNFKNGLDILVNNAGIAYLTPLPAITRETFDSFMHINVFAPLYLILKLTDSLEKKGGSVVNISSVIVGNGKAGLSNYAASKGALEAMTKSLALELAPKNIRVNCVSPGAINTPIISKMGFPAEQIQNLIKIQEGEIPLSRLGRDEEIANVIISQAESTYTTGAVWNVDGGVSAN